MAVRQKQPGKHIYLAGFSSGTRVVLEAGKRLPPNSVDRIILLGSAVSYFADLGPALTASRDGLDNFYNYRDGALELGVAIKGSADGYRAPQGGRIGFWLPSKASPAYPLYQQKLRQYPYQSTIEWTGHYGHHRGWVEYAFIQAYVLPLLDASEHRAKF
jgi:pimeloyl-ACP methyl ester carboxylesterase